MFGIRGFPSDLEDGRLCGMVAEGEEKFGRGDDLAGVTLGVVGDVDEEAAHGCGKFMTTDGAGEFKVNECQITDSRGGAIKTYVKFVEDHSNGRGWFRFCS